MGKLGDVTTTTLNLPGGDWIKVKNELLLGDIMDMNAGATDEEKSIKAFTVLITDWSFTDDGTENSPKVPVTEQAVRKLNTQTVALISDYLKTMIAANEQGLTKDEKKTLSSPSIAATETQVPII